ncbi:MAG: hypothetical protein KAY03_00335 [Arenimonas sp.]|nr:hypothetical protein [Arenimonas sp.]
MNNRHLTLSLAVALAIASPCVSAMGLGQLQVRSGLNQPLVAEIPIISGTPSEIEKLDVRLASPEAFARVGLDLPAELTANLQFSIGKSASGQPVIKVTTPGQFSEPFLSFLIEADWGKGTVTREYTALIDPPFIAPAVIQPMVTPTIAAAPAPVAPPIAPPIAAPVASVPAPEPEVAQTLPAAEPPPVEVAPTPAPPPMAAQRVEPPPQTQARPQPQPRPVAPKPAPVQQAARPQAPAPAPAAAPGQVGPIAPGQALWGIANSVRPDPGVSVNQMMVALLRANPSAFSDENINRLKSGSVLRVPEQDEINRVSEADAAILVSQQASAWRAPRAPVPQPAESGAGEEIVAAPTGPKPAAPRVAGSSPAPSSSRLEIVPPSGDAKARGAQSGAAAGAGGSELRAELVQAREDLAARTSEVKELQSRISELQAQDADRQRLIEMQNSQLKELQDRLKQIEAQQAAAAATGSAPANAQADAAPVAGPPAEVAKPWYLSPFVLAAAVLILLGGLVLAMRRSKASPQGGEAPSRRISDDEALRTSMAKSREAGERIKREPALAPAQTAGAAVQAASSDPELDALTAIVVSHPQDLEAHLNLLRLHHARRNAAGYESAAQAMRLQVGNTTDPRWREAVIMGASLLPGHALFGQAGWNSPRFTDSDASARPAAKAASGAAPVSSVTEPAPVKSSPAPIKVFDAPDEFSLSEADHAAMEQKEAASGKELDLDDHHASIFGDSLGSPPVDIHRNEAEVMVEDEASATRIDLARAYLDFGDLEGARSMLEEVLAEGGPSAKAEAARILKDMG